MRRKVLSVVLCVCMMMTMAPFAFAEEENTVATVNGTGYTSFAEAVAAAEDGQTVTLCNDIELSSQFNISKTLTLDLAGHVLSRSGWTLNVSAGTLTIADSSTKKSGKIVSESGSAIETSFNSGAVVNLTAGTISTYLPLSINKGTSFCISGGTLVGTDDQYNTYVINAYGANLEFNGGTITGANCSVIHADNSTINVTDGLLTSTIQDGLAVLYAKDSNVTVSGGQFKSVGTYGIDLVGQTSTLTVSGGSFDNDTSTIQVESGTANIQDGNFKVFNTDKSYVLNCIDAAYTDGTAKIIVTGGTFENFDPANCAAEGAGTNFCAQGYGTKQEGNNYIVTGPVAVINETETKYPTLAAAITAASDGQTIKLIADTTVSSPIAIQKNITLDLNGKTITTTCSQAFQIVAQNNFAGGSLKVTGEGTINANSKNGTFYLIGTEQSDSNKASKLVIDKDVKIINGAYSVWVQNTASEYASYNVTADIYGSITAIEPIYVSGNIHGTTGNVPVIHLYDSSKIDVTRYDREVYIGGYAKMIIDDGATIINTANDGNAIAIAAGELIVNGGTIIGGNTIKDVEGSGGAISVTTSSAIFVKQHSTNLPVKVEIKGGIFKGAVPFHQATGENGNSAKPEDVNLLISGGYFASTLSTADGGVAVKSDDKTAATNSGFITGGYFTTDPSKYCGTKDGQQLTGVANTTDTKAEYPWTVGVKGEKAAPVVSASLPVSVSENASEELKNAAKDLSDGATMTSDAIEAAVADTANNNKIEGTEALAAALKNALSSEDTIFVADVKIVYQTYVDVELTDITTGTTPGEGSTAATPITELTVNLTPKYRVIATTNDVYASDADLYVAGDGNADGTTNAVLVQDAQPLTLPEAEYEVTIQVPSNFPVDAGQKVSIKHEKSGGKVEYYTGKVIGGDSSYRGQKYVTFTTNGFSPFTISAAAAFIGDTAYPTFQEAVDAVQNNDVITLVKSDAVSATMSGTSRTITVKAPAGATTPVKVTVNGETKSADATNGATFTYTRPSHSSSGSTTTTYNVNVNAATNGTVTADKKTAAKGATVTVTATPSAGYVVDAVKVVDKDGKDVAVTAKDGKYVFTMPGSAVTVSAAFKAETPAPSGLPFTDVKSGDWFYDAVKYAYENGLMTGTSATTFAPNGTMNRAMIVTVLYRLEKSPAVTAAAKFTDVPAGQWYSDAVTWAAANNIVNGYSETSFGPLNAVTREQMAAILFRYEQYKGLENVTLEENLNRFPDQDKISSYAVPAMQWAVGQKIINGNADGTLDPTGTATRAQVAQIFMNLLK